MIRLCESCLSPVRRGKRGFYFHTLPGYPELETIARETGMNNEQQAKAAGVIQQKPSKESMESEVEWEG